MVVERRVTPKAFNTLPNPKRGITQLFCSPIMSTSISSDWTSRELSSSISADRRDIELAGSAVGATLHFAMKLNQLNGTNEKNRATLRQNRRRVVEVDVILFVE